VALTIYFWRRLQKFRNDKHLTNKHTDQRYKPCTKMETLCGFTVNVTTRRYIRLFALMRFRNKVKSIQSSEQFNSWCSCGTNKKLNKADRDQNNFFVCVCNVVLKMKVTSYFMRYLFHQAVRAEFDKYSLHA